MENNKKNNDTLSNKSESIRALQHQNIIAREINVIEDGIKKIKTSIFLPFLIDNPNELNSKLTEEQVKLLIKLCSKYQKPNVDEMKLSESKRELDYRLYKSIEIIKDNYAIDDLADKYLRLCSPICCLFIETMIDFKEIIKKHLKISAMEEVSHERLLHNIHHENEKSKNVINVMESLLHKKEIHLLFKLVGKQAVIQKYKEDLAFKKWENSIRIKKLTVRANAQMEQICEESNKKQLKLQEEVEKVKIIYKDVLKQNILIDKQLRNQKDQLVMQLQTLIKKYDTVMMEKYCKIQNLNEESKLAEKKLDDFMLIFNKQEEQYIKLKTMKDREEQKAFERNLLLFMMTRAAKTIQQFWRKYLKKKKKKPKKGRKTN